MKNRLLIILMLFASYGMNAQHSPIVSHYLLNGVVINPAFAGSKEVFTANVMHRRQWASFKGAPISQLVSVHAPTKKDRVVLGLIVNNDRHGVANNTAFSAIIGYKLPLSDNASPGGKRSLTFALSGGAFLQTANFTDVITNDQNDPAFSYDFRSRLTPDIGAGVYYQDKKWFAGISVPTMVERRFIPLDEDIKVAFQPEQMNLVFQAGYLVKINDQLEWRPSFLAKTIPGLSSVIDFNNQLVVNQIFLVGLSYRHQQTVVAMFEFKVNEQLRLGYAFDYGFNALRSFNNGSHEISLQYALGFKVKSANSRMPF